MKNTKKILSITLTLCLMVAVLLPMTALPAQAVGDVWGGDTDTATAFAGGTGTEADPFQISNGAELAFLASSVNGGTDYNGQHFKLTGDIVLNEGTLDDTSNQWTPIGYYVSQADSAFFAGNFDGAGFEIKGLYINTGKNYQGLFGVVDETGTVQNLNISGSVSAANYVGGVTGNNYGTIINCTNSATIKAKSAYNTAGGVAGYNSGAVINSSNSATVSAEGNNANVGGLVGANDGTVTNSYNTGDLSGGSNATIGGVVGLNYNSRTVTNCYWQTDNGASTGVGDNDGTVQNIGSFENTSSAITLTDGTSNPDSISHDSLLAALNAGTAAYNDTSPAIPAEEWMLKTDENKGYPVFATYWSDYVATEEPTQVGDIYQIEDAADLAWMASMVNAQNATYGSASYTLTKPIDLTGHMWEPIGGAFNQFNGTFDGKGFEVNGLQIDSTDLYLGLFGYVNNDGVIKNLGVSGNVTSSGEDAYVGGVVGYSLGDIIGCNSSVIVTATGNNSHVGGVVGLNNGIVANSYSNGNVTGTIGSDLVVGGVVGDTTIYSIIINSYNTGTVTGNGDNTYVGGVVGNNSQYAAVINSYNTGTVTGTNGNMAVVGSVVGVNTGIAANNYNTGDVSGENIAYVGGVVGINGGTGTITNNYNTGTVSGNTGLIVGGVVGENQNESTVTNSYFLKTADINPEIDAVGTNNGTVTNVGTFANASSAITIDMTIVGNTDDEDIPNENLFGALNTGAHACNNSNLVIVDPNITLSVMAKGWEIVEEENDGYPVFRTYWNDFADGSGVDWTATSIEITTPEQLAHFASLVSGGDDFSTQTVTLGNPISLAGHEWTPIGNESNRFAGTFDGAGHEITNLFIDSAETMVGLFRYVNAGGVIKNLGVSGNVTSSGEDAYVGGVVGYSLGDIIGCNSSVIVTATGNNSHVGGVVAYNATYGKIINSYNTGTVTGNGDNTYVGGVAGRNISSTVTNSYNTGDVTGNATDASSYVGGVAGVNILGSVRNCYNIGDVTGSGSNVGGVVGYSDSTRATITNSYFLKTADINAEIGAVGTDNGTVTNVGTFANASSAITIDMTIVGNTDNDDIPNESLLAALNGGADYYNATTMNSPADYWKVGNPYPVFGKKAIISDDFTVTSSTYGDTLPMATLNDTENLYGEVLSTTYVHNGVELTNRSDAGTYTGTVVTVETATHKGVKTIDFTIEQKEVSITWSDTSLVFNGKRQRPTATLSGVLEGDYVTPAYSAREHDVTQSPIVISIDYLEGDDRSNYKPPSDGSQSTNFTITQAPASGNLLIKLNTDNGTVGTVDVGDVLEVDRPNNGAFNGVLPVSGIEWGSATYQWKRDGVAISGANTATYTLVADDSDKAITCTVTFDGNLTGELTSNGLTVGQKQLSGTVDISSDDGQNVATYDDTLTLDMTGVTTADLGENYTIQWLRDGVAIDGAIETTYTTDRDDVFTNISVKISGKGEYTGSLLSNDTIINPDTPDVTAIKATAGDSKITLSWTLLFDGGAPLMDYLLIYAKTSEWKDDYVSNDWLQIAPDKTSYELTNLENGTEYTMMLFARHGTEGGGALSNIVTATPAVPVSTGGGGDGVGGVATAPDNTVDSEETLTADNFKELAESGDSLTVNGDDEIEAEFDTAALDAILYEAEGKTVEFIAKEADASDVNDAQKIVIGDNLVLDLRVLVDGVEFTDFETGEVTISLPYTLEEGETAANLKVYYVDDEGNKTLIESSYVDGVLTFKTNHFSLYMVVYEAMSFTDVLSGDWYYDAVLYAFENEIMTGTSDTTFAPNDNMTRAMVWTVLARMSGVDTDGGDPWYSVAQDWAVENEVSDGTNPDGNITREEFATMLYRYAGSPMVTAEFVLGEYSDYEQVSEWANLPMDWAVKAGIISGMDDGTLSPQGEATRAQMATMLMRYLTAE